MTDFLKTNWKWIALGAVVLGGGAYYMHLQKNKAKVATPAVGAAGTPFVKASIADIKNAVKSEMPEESRKGN